MSTAAANGLHPEIDGSIDRCLEELREQLDDPNVGVRLLLRDRRGYLRAIRASGEAIGRGRSHETIRRRTLADGVPRILEVPDGPAVGIFPIDRRGDALGIVEVSASTATLSSHRGDIEATIGRLAEVVRREADGTERRKELDLGLAWTAHELRGPLQAVRVWLENAAYADSGSPGVSLHRATRELSRLADDVESLLQWAVGLGEIAYANVDLVELTIDAIDGCIAETGDDRVVVEGADRLMAKVDAVHMRSAIANLIRNALRYSTPGTKVKVTVEDRDGDAAISVENEGPGIRPEDRHTVFEPMGRGPNGRGTGIGLYVVARIVARHDGTIRVYEPAEGRVTFELRLPRRTGRGPASTASANRKPML